MSFAKENGIYFMETSAKTGHNIDQVFYYSACEIEKKINSGVYDISNEVIHYI